jgi:hypothetical protein
MARAEIELAGHVGGDLVGPGSGEEDAGGGVVGGVDGVRGAGFAEDDGWAAGRGLGEARGSQELRLDG